MTTHKVTLAAGLFGATTEPGPGDAIEVSIRYSAHELATPEGQCALTERVADAVREACPTFYRAMKPRLVSDCGRHTDGELVARIKEE